MPKNKISWFVVIIITSFLMSASILIGADNSSTTPTSSSLESGSQKWWGKFGTPQYGGTISLATSQSSFSVDTWDFAGGGFTFWLESLFEPDWTLDRNVWPMSAPFTPDKCYSGNLAESWEINDPQKITVHLHQGIAWQDKAPSNGREFTADDVQFHYDRLLGTGHGYTQPHPFFSGLFSDWERVMAKGKYTVIFEFKKPGSQWFQQMADRFPLNQFECPEWVALGGPPENFPAPPGPSKSGPPKGGPPPPPPIKVGGPLKDWHNAVGTGPWILDNYVSGSAISFVKNPDYYGRDPRYPENQVPYADKLQVLVIPDASTLIAAIRTGKIDIAGNITWQQLGNLKKSNPDLQAGSIPRGANGLAFRLDKAPFTDIRVRKALDMAIDREAILKSHFNGNGTAVPPALVSQNLKGYAFDYSDWPKQLIYDYSYNPEGAKKLLSEAGFPDGFKTNVIVDSSSSDMELMEIIKSYFSDVGVDMEIRPMDHGTFDSVRMSSKHDQMYSASAGGSAPKFSVTLFYSKGPDHNSKMLNDPKYDRLYSQFFNAVDVEKATRIFQEMDMYVFENHWQVVSGEYFNYNVVQPHIIGYSGEEIAISNWSKHISIARLWVNQNQK